MGIAKQIATQYFFWLVPVMHCDLYIHIHLHIGMPIVICPNGNALSLFFLSYKNEMLIVVVLEHIQWSAWFYVAL